MSRVLSFYCWPVLLVPHSYLTHPPAPASGLIPHPGCCDPCCSARGSVDVSWCIPSDICIPVGSPRPWESCLYWFPQWLHFFMQGLSFPSVLANAYDLFKILVYHLWHHLLHCHTQKSIQHFTWKNLSSSALLSFVAVFWYKGIKISEGWAKCLLIE